jgi:hypothetical protein
MRLITLLLPVVFAATIAVSRSPQPAQDAPDLIVLKSQWSKERIGWEQDPFGGPLENFDEMRARARNEKRIDDAKRAGGGSGVERLKAEARADEANMAQKREQTQSRYVFVYKVTVKNNSTKEIKTVDWDYVFFARGSENEIGRRQFSSDEKIPPGKTRELSVVLSKPPTQTISVTALKKDERESLSEKVIVLRVEYADGSVWQRPE